MSTDNQHQVHTAAVALRETADTLDRVAKNMPEYPVVVPSPQGHHLSINEDGSISLTPPEGEGAGWYWPGPSDLWEALETMPQRSQPEDGGDPEADDLMNRFREFLYRRAEPQAPVGGSDVTGSLSEESMINTDGPHPEVVVKQREDDPSILTGRYRDGLPIDADGEFILVEDPEELDLAESIAEHVAQEQLRGGLANADLPTIERYQNQVKKLKGALAPGSRRRGVLRSRSRQKLIRASLGVSMQIRWRPQLMAVILGLVGVDAYLLSQQQWLEASNVSGIIGILGMRLIEKD